MMANENFFKKNMQRCIYVYILVIQRFRVVYRGISHESLVFSCYINEPLGECVYQENTSDEWDIPRHTTRKRWVTIYTMS